MQSRVQLQTQSKLLHRMTCKGPNVFKFLASYIVKCTYVHGLVLRMQVAVTVEVRVILLFGVF